MAPCRSLEERCDDILADIRRHEEDEGLCKSAVTRFIWLAQEATKEQRAMMVDKGCHEAVLAVMAKFAQDAGMQDLALRALAHLSACAKAQRMLREGLAATLFSTLQAFPTEKMVQEVAMGTLANLARGATTEQRQEMLERTCMAAEEAMRAHPTVAAVQVSAVLAVCNTTRSAATEQRQRMLRDGWGGRLLACMEAFPADAQVQEHALGALGNLARAALKKQKREMWEQACSPVQEAMTRHASVMEVQEKALWALDSLTVFSVNAEHLQSILRAGLLGNVLASMKVLPAEAQVQEKALAVLINLAANATKEQKDEMMVRGCSEAAQAAIQKHPDAASIQRKGSALLKQLHSTSLLQKYISALKRMSSTGKPASAAEAVRACQAEFIEVVSCDPLQDFATTVKTSRSVWEHFRKEIPCAFPELAPAVEFYVREGKALAEEKKVAAAELAPKMDADELWSIVVYTMNRDEGITQNLYYHINAALQTRSAKRLKGVKHYLHFLLRGLKKIPVAPPDAQGDFPVVFRGIPSTHRPLVAANYLKGRPITWSGITSVSDNEEVAKREFAGPGGVLFRITARTARAISRISKFPDEKELVLLPDFKAFVTSGLTKVEGAAMDIWIVELLECDPAAYVH